MNEKHEIDQISELSPEEKATRISELKFKVFVALLTKIKIFGKQGCSIEDLALNFTFPGHEEIELIEKGEETPVNLANLDQYVIYFG